MGSVRLGIRGLSVVSRLDLPIIDSPANYNTG